MANPWDEMRDAVRQAEYTLRAADDCANTMAELLLGRLHKVSAWKLRQLKRELTNFDAGRRVWKERK